MHTGCGCVLRNGTIADYKSTTSVQSNLKVPFTTSPKSSLVLPIMVLIVAGGKFVDLPPMTIHQIDEALHHTERGEYPQSSDTLRLIALKRLRNTFAPIHRLPPECVAEIFRVEFAEPLQWDVKRLRQLASVCKSWREYVISSPSLWSRIDIRMPVMDDVNALVLRKNTSAALDIWLRSPGGVPMSSCLATALKTSHRWRSLLVTTAKHAAELQPLWSTLPEDMALQCLDLFYGSTNFPWGCKAFRRLEVLWLRDLERTFSLIGPLLETLRCTPLLRKLVLKFRNSDGSIPQDDDAGLGRQTSPYDESPVVLSLLSTLIIKGAPSRFLNRSLSFLVAKSCRCLAIDGVPFSHFDPLSSSPFLTLAASALPLSGSLNVVWDASGSSLTISGGYPEEARGLSFQMAERAGIRLQVRGVDQPQWEHISRWMRANTQASIVPELRYLHHIPAIARGILADASCADTLIVSCGDPGAVLNCLAEPQVDENGIAYWLMPNLINLSLSCSEEVDGRRLASSCLRMVRARSSQPIMKNVKAPAVNILTIKVPRQARKLLQNTKEFSNVVFYSKSDAWGLRGRLTHALDAPRSWISNTLGASLESLSGSPGQFASTVVLGDHGPSSSLG